MKPGVSDVPSGCHESTEPEESGALSGALGTDRGDGRPARDRLGIRRQGRRLGLEGVDGCSDHAGRSHDDHSIRQGQGRQAEIDPSPVHREGGGQPQHDRREDRRVGRHTAGTEPGRRPARHDRGPEDQTEVVTRTGAAARAISALAALAVIAALLLALAGTASARAPRPSLQSASAAIVVDSPSGAVLLQKHPDARRAIASTTKLMTALLVLEHDRMNATFTAPAYSALPAESKINLRK